MPEERFDTLVESDHVHIERIVSKGHTSPEQGWYDQQRNEFVLVLKGAARLEFEDGRVENMGPGDWLDIPAHAKHRVAWTDESQETVWMAVHYD
jgi:cupin 2 domain-containing protein